MEVRQPQDPNRNGNINPSNQAPQGQPQGQNSFNASPQQNNGGQQSNNQQQPSTNDNQQQQPSNNNNQQQPQQSSQQDPQQTNQQQQGNSQPNNNQLGSSNNNVNSPSNGQPQGSAQSGNGRDDRPNDAGGNQQAGGDQRGNSGGQSSSDGRDRPSDQSNDPGRQNQQSSNSDNHSGERQGDGSRQSDQNGTGQGGSSDDRGRGDSREGSDDNRDRGDSRGSDDDRGREGSRGGSNDDRGRNGSDSRENNGSQESNRGDRNFDNGGEIEGGSSKTAIIAGSAAGAVLILLLLGFVFWRRRRGASYSDIVRCRKHTSSVVLEQGGGDGKVIARPIYHEEHYAKNASQPDVLRNMSEPPPMGMNETSHRGSVVEANLWKSANPPLPSPEEPGAWPLADSSPTLISDSPASASSPSRQLYRDRAQPPRYELSRSNTGLSLVRQQTDGMTSEDEDKLKSPHSPINTRGGRWSWTNSQAPSTPRAEVPNKRSSLTSFTWRNVPNWMSSRQNQLDKEAAAAAEKEKEKVKLGTAKSVPMLKNHAVRPILAPPPAVARKVSGRKAKKPHRRVGSLSMIFKPTGSGASSPRSPVSPATLEEGHRLSTSTATVSPVVEMNPQSRWR
ncbi:hypothetical protein Slin15195_G033770 [Septoria linicola]|uniref:Uncharacterized protein n=1 Tax=Septoria linicola TaxID=215465 RepID=A0A9Q9EI78_9PEZI|nr:hypothetical protein Slin15195_G033770 [Septoria linicola]